jgi:DnaJ-class molecular chaperone
MAMLPCKFCAGSGIDPFFGSRQRPSNCAVCKGKKENFVPDPNADCPNCKGGGRDPRYKLPDSFCQGKGFVAEYKANEYLASHGGAPTPPSTPAEDTSE